MKVGSKLLGTKANDSLTKLAYLLRKELPAGFDASLTSGWISLLKLAAEHTDSAVQMQYMSTCEMISATPLKQFVENQGIDLNPNPASFAKDASKVDYSITATPVLTEMVNLDVTGGVVSLGDAASSSASEEKPARPMHQRAVFEARELHSTSIASQNEVTAINFSLADPEVNAAMEQQSRSASGSSNQQLRHGGKLGAKDGRRLTLAERLGIAGGNEQSSQFGHSPQHQRALRLKEVLRNEEGLKSTAFASRDPSPADYKRQQAEERSRGWSSLSSADFS